MKTIFELDLGAEIREEVGALPNIRKALGVKSYEFDHGHDGINYRKEPLYSMGLGMVSPDRIPSSLSGMSARDP